MPLVAVNFYPNVFRNENDPQRKICALNTFSCGTPFDVFGIGYPSGMLISLLTDDRQRLRGVTEAQLPNLGRGNLKQIRQQLQTLLSRMVMEGEDRDEIRAARAWLDRLDEWIAEAPARPRLPALRVEHFSEGDDIVAYLGDTPGALVQGWVGGRVVSIEKSHKPAWSHHPGTRGYYWRVTARMEQPVFPGSRALPFSTTEPRVLLRSELDWLREHPALPFVQIFSENARRDWAPIWCIEREVSPPAPMDMAQWLRAGVSAGR